jgi:hypothetical protein
MCDYSLHAVASRPAKVGDRLMSCSFEGTYTRGFCEVGEPKVAVCLLPGTELAFEREAETDHPFRRLLPSFGFGRTGSPVARFRRIKVGRPDQHHDALEFPNGRVVLVTRLCKGQRATVLQLPAGAVPAHVEPSLAELSLAELSLAEPSHAEFVPPVPVHDPAAA